MRLDDLIPTWPIGFDRWESVVTLILLGLFKLDRGGILKHRSAYIDRFGWSIIVFDITFGLAALHAVLVSLYPGLFLNIWQTRIATAVVVVAVLWQWWEVRTAPYQRVHEAMAGATNGHPVERPPTSKESLQRTAAATERTADATERIADDAREHQDADTARQDDAIRTDAPPSQERRTHYRRLEDRQIRGLE